MRARCVVAWMGRYHLLNLLVLVVVLGLVRTVVHVAVLGAVLVLPLMMMMLLPLLVPLLVLLLVLLLLLLLLLLLPPQMLGLERLSPPKLLLCGHATRLALVLSSAPLGLLDLHMPLLLDGVVTAPPRLFALVLQRGDLTSVERRHAAAAAAAAVAVVRAVETRLGVHHDEPGAHARYLGRRHTGLLVLQRLGVQLVLERAPERVGPVEGGAPFLGAGAAVLD